MKLLNKIFHFEGFVLDWRRLMVRGVIILIVGLLIALASVTNPDVKIMSAKGFSWLPVSGFFIFLLGVMECLDAFLSKDQLDVVQNLQVGVLDAVVGLLIVCGISSTLARESMMIAAFLITRGIVRLVFVISLKLPHRVSTSLAGLISIILGTLVFIEWPTQEGWFISFCLSIEIAFRGWAGISFALWVRQQKIQSE